MKFSSSLRSLVFLFIFFLTPNFSFASEGGVGIGASAGVRFNLAENVFADSTMEGANKDYVFTEPEAFINQFSSGNIKQNYGGRVNLGYQLNAASIYASGGYVVSSFDYQEGGNPSQSVTKGAPFYGFGAGYDFTKRVGMRVDTMFYNFNFTPRNSVYGNVEVKVVVVSLGVVLRF